jgi:hypothetical protein
MKPSIISSRGIVLFAVFIVFVLTMALMAHGFSYDATRNELLIGSKLWSDFGAHIPLIRSFSEGSNLDRLFSLSAIESPLFPGEPIRYHFGFYALVGLLEKLGIRIDWALNLPSAAGMTLLLVSLFLLAKNLFRSRGVAVLSVLFFLFNGSLGFLYFFAHHPLSPSTVVDIVTNSVFPVFGPWDKGNITAFWTLNIYTNQRHLAFSYGLLLLILYLTHKKPGRSKTVGIGLGVLISLLMTINFAVTGIAVLFVGWMFLVRKSQRSAFLIAAGISCVMYALLRQVSNVTSIITWEPGYLIRAPVSVASFLRFWGENIGLHLFLIPLGMFLAPKEARRTLAPPVLLLFLLGNLFRFSPDMINNHKFFNFALLIGNMFSATAVLWFVQTIRKFPSPLSRTILGPLAGVFLVACLTLSGIIDLFPVINDTKGRVPDVAANPDAAFIANNTKTTDVIANTTWFYHPASLAGRSLYSGYTYFTWSYGYDQGIRESSLVRIYEAKTRQNLCHELRSNDVQWIELNPQPESYLHPHTELWESLPYAYRNEQTNLKMYKTADICRL